MAGERLVMRGVNNVEALVAYSFAKVMNLTPGTTFDELLEVVRSQANVNNVVNLSFYGLERAPDGTSKVVPVTPETLSRYLEEGTTPIFAVDGDKYSLDPTLPSTDNEWLRGWRAGFESLLRHFQS